MTRIKHLHRLFALAGSLLMLGMLAPALAAEEPKADAKPLRVEEAFQLRVLKDEPGKFLLDFVIQPGYYLYQSKMAVSIPDGGGEAVAEFSQNTEIITDEFFGTQNIYRVYASAELSTPPSANIFHVAYQGCWDGGICYPVQETRVDASGATTGTAGIILTRIAVADSGQPELEFADANAPPRTDSSNYRYYLSQLLGKSLPLVLLLFFLAGLGLTFTPCVLPMLPILSGIITGANRSDVSRSGINSSVKDHPSLKRQLSLGLTYVLLMSLTFSVLGFFSSVIGYGLRDIMASPVAILIMSALVIALALSMLNVLTLRMPAFITQPIDRVLAGKPGQTEMSASGQYLKAATWGFLSPFIVGSCLSAPLAAALIYLAEQGNPWFGSLSLLALSWGMGLPVLLFAVGLGQLLPASGAYLVLVQRIFALLLLALANFLLYPLLPELLADLIYIAIAIGILYFVCGLFLSQRRAHIVSVVALVLAVVGFSFYGELLSPNGMGTKNRYEHIVINDYRAMQELRAAAAAAKQAQIFYYYADWCISCRELEWLVFSDPQVAAKLAQLEMVKVDVTKNDAEAKRLNQEFDIFGPPTLIFIAKDGRHLEDWTLIGTFSKATFIAQLDRLLAT